MFWKTEQPGYDQGAEICIRLPDLVSNRFPGLEWIPTITLCEQILEAARTAARSQASPQTLASHHLFVSPTICFGKSQNPISLSSTASHPPHTLLITSTCHMRSLIHTSFPLGFIFLPNIFSIAQWHFHPLGRDFIFNSVFAFPPCLAYHGLSHLASCLPAEIGDFVWSLCTSHTQRAQLSDLSRKYKSLRPWQSSHLNYNKHGGQLSLWDKTTRSTGFTAGGTFYDFTDQHLLSL